MSLMWTDNRNTPGPVSYTHLDVYKRQEYAHVQQPSAQLEDPDATVLTTALIEGGAEFVGELISGSVSYRHPVSYTHLDVYKRQA